MKDKELKERIYKEGILKDFNTMRRDYLNGEYGSFLDFLEQYDKDVFRVCFNLHQNKKRKRKRVYDKVGLSILSGNAYFVTLTFTDDILSSTSEKTRRRYVSRAFKAIGYRYLANIDYGSSETHREHYHGIVEPYPWGFASWVNGKRHYVDMPDFRQWCDRIGFVSIEKIGNSDTDMVKVAKYTAKIGAHALKKSTLQGCASPRLIYSR